MIYTVTFNPSLDYIVSVEDFKLGLTNRTSSVLSLIHILDQEKGLGAVKNKEGKLFLPVFTDIEEFHKFNREGKFRPFAVDSIKIPEMLTDEMNGTAVNPLGVNVVLNITKKRVQDSEA